MWTVENAAKTLVWMKNFLSVFKKQKTDVFGNALVWTGPYTRIGIYCFGLNSKIWKLLNTRGVVKQSGRDGVSFEPFTPMEFLCQSASDPTSHIENQDVQSQLDVEDALSNVFESNAAGVTNFSIV